jgi:hypothetical protein
VSDEKIRAVLRRAAEDPGFHDALMHDRASALDACPAVVTSGAASKIAVLNEASPSFARFRRSLRALRPLR